MGNSAIRTYREGWSALYDMDLELLRAKDHAFNLQGGTGSLGGIISWAAGTGDDAESLIDSTDAYVKGLLATIPVSDDVMNDQWNRRVSTALDQTTSTVKAVTGADSELTNYSVVDLLSDTVSNIGAGAGAVVKKVGDAATSIAWPLIGIAIAALILVIVVKR